MFAHSARLARSNATRLRPLGAAAKDTPMKTSTLALVLSLGLAAPAHASANAAATKATKSKATKGPAKDAEHELQVDRLQRFMHKETTTEGTAAYFNIVPKKGLTQNVVVQSSYERSLAEEIVVKGAKDGIYHATLLGSVSAHDFGEVGTAQFKSGLAQRVKSDKVRVSYDYGLGTAKTIVGEKASDIVTRIDLAIPLNPNKSGVTRILYDRVDKQSGYVAGNAEAYPAGRIEVIRQK